MSDSLMKCFTSYVLKTEWTVLKVNWYFKRKGKKTFHPYRVLHFHVSRPYVPYPFLVFTEYWPK